MPVSPRLLGPNRKVKAEPAPSSSGKTDLLLRFFDSHFFDEWIALTYLYKSNSAGVQDYLCNRLYGLPEAGIEKYLSQLCQLLISRNFASLERVLIALCAKSLRIAVKVYWLLTAIAQDQPKNKAVGELRDNCERAALEGSWEPPFRNHKLLPLSPPRSRQPLSPTLGSSLVSRLSREFVSSSSGRAVPPLLLDRVGSPDAMAVYASRAASPDPITRPTSPDGLGGGMYSSYSMAQGLEGLIYASPTAVRSSGSAAFGRQRQEGSSGRPAAVSPEPEVMSPPSSPRLRHSTFGATLDFIEALCDASSGLTAFVAEDRQWALRRGLEEINLEIEAASRAGVASCWFPMGTRHERIIRLAAKEASLLNSREKAPFVLIVETLAAEGQTFLDAQAAAAAAAAATSSDGSPQPDQSDDAQSSRRRASGQYADSVNSLLAGRLESHAAAGPGPGSPQRSSSPVRAGRAQHRRNDTASSRLPSPGSPATSVVIREGDSPAEQNSNLPVRSELTSKRSLTFSEALAVVGNGDDTDLPQQHATPATANHSGVQSSNGPSPRPSPRQLGRSPHGKVGHNDDPLTRGLQAVVDGLRGDGPLVSVQLDIKNDHQLDATPAPTPTPFRLTPEPPTPSSEGPMTGPSSKALSRSIFSPDRRRGLVGSPPADSVLPAKGMGLLARLGFCRRPFSDDESETAVLPKPATRSVVPEPYVRLRLKVIGGVDLRLGNRTEGKHRRVPSEEALLKMAAQQNTPIPFPAAFSPIPEDYETTVQQLQQQQQQQQHQQQQRAPSQPSGATTFAERINGFFAGIIRTDEPSNSPSPTGHQQEQQPFEQLGSAVPLFESAGSPADHNVTATANAGDFGVAGGGFRPNAAAAGGEVSGNELMEDAQQGSPGSDPSLQRVASGASASTSGEGEGLSQSRSGLGEGLSQSRSGLGEGLSQSRSGLSFRERARAEAIGVYGERFAAKCKRIQSESPHGRRPGWAVRPVIVKSGDDCRQELLAVQLISTFHSIFQEAQLPLWVRPYEVLVTSNRTALIELIPDSLSIHTIKAKSPPGTSLRDHFMARYGQGTAECLEAQRHFAESMAGYSLVCYFLQIKDRHNGNIMLDEQGHIIHIDFGFMLSNSPGGVNFEAAPFKLTRELLEVLDSNSEGRASELFDYYKVLCIQGFLACRKHADRVLLLVEMMQGSGCPAFKAGARCIHNLRKRFHLSLTETQCVEVVLGMISDSLDAWRTRQYDYYQRVLNGIL